MSTLAQIQQRFLAYVLSGGADMNPAIVEQGEADVARRLDVYYQAYRLRLAEVLGNDFTGVKTLAGDRFGALCHAYVEASPSPHFNVRWYADRFADFLANNPETASTPALAEMAALEWDLTLVFDAPDENLIVLDDVAIVPPQVWGTMRFGFSSALRTRELHWNVAAIRLAIDDDEVVPGLALLAEPQTHAIWRDHFNVRHRALGVDEAAALNAAREGASFGDLCVLLCEWHAEDVVAMRAAELLKNWIHDQWIAALHADEADGE